MGESPCCGGGGVGGADGVDVVEGDLAAVETVCFVDFGYVFGVGEGDIYALEGIHVSNIFIEERVWYESFRAGELLRRYNEWDGIG